MEGYVLGLIICWGRPPGPQGSYSTLLRKFAIAFYGVNCVFSAHNDPRLLIAHFLVCLNYVVALGQFFLLSVSARLKKRTYLNNLIHGEFGSTWGDNFYIGMQNGLKLEIRPA